MGILDKLGLFAEQSSPIDDTQPKEELEEDELLEEYSLYRHYNQYFDGVEEWQDPVTIDTYKQMYRQDAQVRAGVSAIKLPILAKGYMFKHPVDSAGWDDKKDEIEKQIEFLDYVFKNMAHSFDDALEQILSAIVYGFSVAEPVYVRYKDGEFRGKIGLKKVKILNPSTVKFKMNDYGDVVEIIQQIGDKKINIPVGKVIHYAFESEFGSPYGSSALHPVHYHWYTKKMIYKFANMAYERNGAPLLVGKVKNKNEVSKMKKVLDNILGRTGVAISGTDEIGVLDTTKTMDFVQYINHLNMMILRGLMIPSLVFGNEGHGTGSYALGQTHFDLYLFRLQSIQRELEKLVNDKIIKKLIDINFGKQQFYPQFKFKPLMDADRDKLADVFFKLVNAQIIEPTEPFIRDMMGLPQMDNEHKERVKKEADLKLKMLEHQAEASEIGLEQKKAGATGNPAPDQEQSKVKLNPESNGTEDMNTHPFNTKGRGDIEKKQQTI